MDEPTCSAVSDCKNRPHARGLCSGHYERWRTGREIDTPLTRRGGATCTVRGCDSSKRVTRGMCHAHYERQRKGLPLDPGLRRYAPGSLCSMPECDARYYGDGFCRFHYTRRRNGIDLHVPLRDGRIKDKKGYVLIRVPGYGAGAYRGGYVMEHRLVMEQVLGRRLVAGENVHHINGVRDDNRPDNLELWVTSQPSGQRVGDLVAWAREILSRYDGLEVAQVADDARGAA